MAAYYEINVDENEQQGMRLTIFINHQIRDADGRVVGITGVGLDTDTVAGIVSRYERVFGRSIYFVDAAGAITVRSRDAAVREATIQAAAGMAEVADHLLTQSDEPFAYDRDGETYLAFTRYLPELGWWVVMEQRLSDRVGPIRRSFLTSLLIGLAVSLAVIAVVVWMVDRAHRRLEGIAATDALTGAGNRRVFDLHLDRALRLARRRSEPFAVLLFDIDHFKRLNDIRGHLEGDRAIRTLTDRVAARIRGSDVLARWGGDELVVLADHCGAEQAEALAQTIVGDLRARPIDRLPDGAAVTVSAAVAVWRREDTAETLMRRADGALYAAKQAGRDSLRVA